MKQPSIPSPAVKPRALTVPAEVLALEGIPLTTKLILADVIDLYKVKKHVSASDEHFATRSASALACASSAQPRVRPVAAPTCANR